MKKSLLRGLLVAFASAGVVLSAGCSSCGCTEKCDSKVEKKCDSKEKKCEKKG